MSCELMMALLRLYKNVEWLTNGKNEKNAFFTCLYFDIYLEGTVNYSSKIYLKCYVYCEKVKVGLILYQKK